MEKMNEKERNRRCPENGCRRLFHGYEAGRKLCVAVIIQQNGNYSIPKDNGRVGNYV